MSAAIVDFQSRGPETIGVTPDGNLPARGDGRERYEALLQVADERLGYNFRRCKSRPANPADTKRDELDAGHYTLRRNVYVRMQSGAPGQESIYRAEPPEAEPEEWVHREGITGVQGRMGSS